MTIREIKATANMAGFGIPNPISGVLFGGEDQAHKFIISNQDGAAFSGTVSAKFLRYADNATVPLTGSIEAGKATVTLIENCYARPGRFKLTVYVTADGSTTAVYCCMGTVDRTDGSTTVDPSGEINLDVTDLINDIATARASIPPEYSALLASIAPTFSASTAYPAGAYVWYDGTLYRFATNHAAGTWTGTDATAVVVSDDLEINWQYNMLNSRNLLDDYPLASSTAEGITCTPNGDGSYTLTGTNSGSNESMFFFIFGGAIPSELKPGRKYRCEIDSSTVHLRFIWYSSISPDVYVGDDSGTGAFTTTVRAAANYVTLFIFVPGHTTINETVHPRVFVPIGMDSKVNVFQGVAHAGQALVIDDNGYVTTGEAGAAVDPTLSIAGDAADAKVTGDEITELKSAVTLYTGNTKYTGWVQNKWIKYTAPQTQVNETGWESILIQCNPGDVFSVRGYGGGNPRLWCFSDSQGNALSYPSGVVVSEDFIEITAPANAAYLACNSKYTEFHGELVGGRILKRQTDALEYAIKENGFNQVVPHGDFDTTAGWIGNGSPSWVLSAASNVLTATVKSNAMKLQRDKDYPTITVGHKYFATVQYYGSDLSRVAIAIGLQTKTGDTTANTWNKIATVISVTSVNGDRRDCQIEVGLANNYTVESIQIKNFWVVDLTAMYGAGNEPTAEEFEAMYANAYYPYQTIMRDAEVIQTIVGKNIGRLGTAIQKDYTNTVENGGNGLPTSVAVKTAIDNAVSEVSQNISTGISRDAYLIKQEIPSQYTDNSGTPTSFDDDEYLEKTIAGVPNGRRFMFFTDTHWPSNEKHTIPLVDYVRKRLGIPKVVFGGDILTRSDNGYLAKQVVTDFMYEAKSAFANDLLPTIGNHETNESNMQSSSYTDEQRAEKLLPFSQLMPIFMSDILGEVHTEYDVVKDDLADYASGDNLEELKAYFKTIYYVDDHKNKTRYIVLNTGNPGSRNYGGGMGVISEVFHIGWTGELRLQFEWFAQTLMTVPTNYDVVVIGHQLASENAVLDMINNTTRIIMRLCYAAMKRIQITITPGQVDSYYSALQSWYSNSAHIYDYTEIPQIRSIIMVCGHAHFDGISLNGYNSNDEYVSTVYDNETIDQVADGTIPLIVTTTDAYQSWDISIQGATKVPMTLGTTTDHAFDVFTYVSDGIDIKRFGAGYSRKVKIDFPNAE